MGLWIMIREVEGTIQVIQIVAIGKQDKETIYTMAEERLSWLKEEMVSSTNKSPAYRHF